MPRGCWFVAVHFILYALLKLQENHFYTILEHKFAEFQKQILTFQKEGRLALTQTSVGKCVCVCV